MSSDENQTASTSNNPRRRSLPTRSPLGTSQSLNTSHQKRRSSSVKSKSNSVATPSFNRNTPQFYSPRTLISNLLNSGSARSTAGSRKINSIRERIPPQSPVTRKPKRAILQDDVEIELDQEKIPKDSVNTPLSKFKNDAQALAAFRVSSHKKKLRAMLEEKQKLEDPSPELRLVNASIKLSTKSIFFFQ